MAKRVNNSKDSAPSDNELIARICKGDEKSFNELFFRYKEVIAVVSHSYYSNSFSPDDWFQEGVLGFIAAVHSYNENDADASFKTYVTVCVKNRLNSVWRSANGKKNEPLNNRLQYDDATVLSVSSPEDSYIENERYRFFTGSFLEQLSKTERKVILYYLAGFSYKEIATGLNIAEKSVDNALCRAKSKLKKSFEP